MGARQNPENLPIVSSAYLFRRLFNLYRASLVCDVGSFDGSHALRFSGSGIRVVALEANPKNAESLARNGKVADAGIDVFHLAAWNKDENVMFNVVGTRQDDPNQWREMVSSIRSRNDSDHETQKVTVTATRLDSFVSALPMDRPRSIALWIDVEGVGFEVIEGIRDIRDVVCVIHIEVETIAFWERQHLWPEVQQLMQSFGFTAVARGRGHTQFDVVFVKDKYRSEAPFATRWLMLIASARLRLGRVYSRIRQVVPKSTHG